MLSDLSYSPGKLVQSHSLTCSLSKPSSQAQARALWGMGGGGTDIFLRTGEISRGFHGSCLYTHTADKLSSEDIGTESTDRCTELHSISCIGPEI